ncbi:MAG: 1-deoxy-D-xylulose-5-phosphate reductoisomerase [Candidatus Marinimicrobia bacterium]|nr:1-deoxy-D-xylulose-5-phosphate reductoisomerase [Candidatus Neomarinimicrobiota bacterium]
MKDLTILGATGSIGSNTLKVIDANPDTFNIKYLTAGSNAEKLAAQAKKYKPTAIAIANKQKLNYLQTELSDKKIDIYGGRDGILEIAGRDDVDLVVNSIVGPPGMEPTYKVVNAGVDIALSNKESLVMAGSVIMKQAEQKGLKIYPIDSEHNAIWQCLRGEDLREVAEIILTASGGPFRTLSYQELKGVTPEQALDHPTWNMGRKITIDSATMMNKGFEIIEAHWLFNMPANKIDVVVHPQSIIHSMVEFCDGSIKAQLGLPDMKLPIQYALFYPQHREVRWENTNLAKIRKLTFEEPDYRKFTCLKLAQQAVKEEGTASAILNVANDKAVYAFLNGNIKFTEIPVFVEKALDNIKILSDPEFGDILETQRQTEEFIDNELNKRK